MKKLYFLIVLMLSQFSDAQIINFPDANFKAKLLQPGTANVTIDANGDGEIEVSEAQLVEELYLSDSNIADRNFEFFRVELFELQKQYVDHAEH